MPPQTIESRVTSLERRVTQLEQLPARIDDLTSQVSQLRTEARGEFSAVRAAIAERATAVEMRVLYEDVISRLALLQAGLSARPKRKPRKKP
jgi:cell division protein FtsB